LTDMTSNQTTAESRMGSAPASTSN
jgi:hypothetical protein